MMPQSWRFCCNGVRHSQRPKRRTIIMTMTTTAMATMRDSLTSLVSRANPLMTGIAVNAAPSISAAYSEMMLPVMRVIR